MLNHPGERNRVPVLPQRIRQRDEEQRHGPGQDAPGGVGLRRVLAHQWPRDDAVDREGNRGPDAQHVSHQGAGGCAALVEEKECNPDQRHAKANPALQWRWFAHDGQDENGEGGTIAISSDEEKGEVRLSPRMNPSW